ncbi:LOB domain-containing protein 25-like [Nicotiana tabacum]|uniref:LOB domain-containing protein 25-like n=1 Tax=Nicotiana tabacum TaxID=4097 RepID=A0A1S4CXF4_TOBAC|nr:LOB domain-containing protein 25-like isoform X1 [Nicotiana tomentosiformis]XP_016505823.1 PREDICTED: LOB domain-containing protein 25-like [Nicotiana tabacum]XP_018625398.1 LOB domain-containing protein 25-like isoform X1 [Nicotiana tomentosiformis]XP_018625399.1 LOB domain-containing protein 25-like isoform X1 [Nicotiana tomentosiformis]
MASSSSYSNPPCAACKFLRRKCLPGCIFAPYFPPEEPTKFANVHKIFGASNVSKLLNEIQPHQREDAVNSLAYEAEARMKDPVYGCVGAISVLQRQVIRLQKELDATNADLMRYTNREVNNSHAYNNPSGGAMNNQMVNQQRSNLNYGRRMGPVDGTATGFDQTYGFCIPNYSPNTWNSNTISGNHNPEADDDSSM